MGARLQLPGIRQMLRFRNVAVRLGVLTGIYLSCTFFAWLLIANHIPQLEPFANIRNLIALAIMFFLIAIPILRFRHEPAKMFLSGLVAWTLLTFTYFAAELHYTLLETRMGTLHLLILGVSSYGLVAVFQWVFLLCAEARQQHIAHSQQAPASGGRPRSH
jgi:hypothetical protein